MFVMALTTTLQCDVGSLCKGNATVVTLQAH